MARQAKHEIYKRFYAKHRTEILNRHKRRAFCRRAAAISLLGGRCVLCGNEDTRILEIDHRNNDGYLMGRSRGVRTTEKILNNTVELNTLQLLCPNCHALKTKGYL